MLARNIVEQRTVLLENLLPIDGRGTYKPYTCTSVYIRSFVPYNVIAHSSIDLVVLAGMNTDGRLYVVCSQVVGTVCEN